MSKVWVRGGIGVAVYAVVVALLLVQAFSEAAGGGKGKEGATIKRFTGILSGPGGAGTNEYLKAGYFNFICDPRTVNWDILINDGGGKGKGKGKGNATRFIGDPKACDHVEVIMEYYDPKIPGPVGPGLFDGIAIVVRKIP